MSQYASRAELAAKNLPAAALEEVDRKTIDEILVSNSGLVDTYLRGRYRLPLTGALPVEGQSPNTYPPEIVAAVLALTAFDVLTYRGSNPDEYDTNFRTKRDFYLGTQGQKGWLDKLSAGAVSIDASLDATPTTYEGGAVVFNGSARGWGDDSNSVGEPIGNFWGAPKPD